MILTLAQRRYQFWKVLFSINLLGDPIGLGTSVAGHMVDTEQGSLGLMGRRHCLEDSVGGSLSCLLSALRPFGFTAGPSAITQRGPAEQSEPTNTIPYLRSAIRKFD